MAVSLKHSKVSAVADGADTSLVRPSDWNAEHVLTQGTGTLLGRTTAGTGATEEISPSSELTLTSGTLGIASSISGKTLTSATVIEDNSSSAALRITQTGAGNALVVEDSANPDATPFVVDASGNVVQGNTSPLATIPYYSTGNASTPALQQISAAAPQLAITGHSSSQAFGPAIALSRASGDSVSAPTAVSSGFDVGAVSFSGYDGTGFIRAAQILAEVDGTPDTNDMPGRLVFSTTADGAATPTERMRISSAGNVLIGTTSAFGKFAVYNATAYNNVFVGDAETNVISQRSSTDTAGASLILRKSRGTAASPTAVASGDGLGQLTFQGYGGASARSLAVIQAVVDTYVSDTDISSYMRFSTSSAGGTTATERMRIDSAGKVQIGTTTAGGTLTVYDATDSTLSLRGDAATNLIIQRASTDINNAAFITRKARGTIASPTAVATGDNIGIVNFTAYGGTNFRGLSQMQATVEAYVSDTDIASTLIFRTSPAGGVTATERVRITSAGNVGIGTSSPAALTHIQSTTAATNTVTDVLRLDSQSSGTPANGIGVGMEFAVETTAGNTEVGATIEAVVTDVTAASEDFALTFNTMAAGATAAERVRIASTGNVGIGTNNPTEKLVVVGPTIVAGQTTANQTSSGSFDHNVAGNSTRILSWGSSGVGGDITFWTGSGGAGATQRARLTSAGGFVVGTSTDPGAGLIADVSGNVRSLPQNAQTTGYTLVASDNGKHISITTGGVTVPSGVFSIGDTVTIYNNSGSSQTITQGASATVRQAGTANTGNRTLAQYGVCTVLCVASNTFVITGAGLT